MSFDRDAYIRAGRKEIDNTIASIVRGNHRLVPATRRILDHLISVRYDHQQRLEAEVELQDYYVEALRRERDVLTEVDDAS